MAILPIIIAPDPRLKVKCEPVGRVDADVLTLMDDLMESMYADDGIGLAAPQVGVQKRVIVVDVTHSDAESTPLGMADPEIVRASDEMMVNEEGCLSLPEHYAEVTRPAEIGVRYLDRDNEIRELDAKGILSTCIQHEMDHLDGVLFVDHLSALKRNIILRKLAKTKKAKEPATA
ncbi:MAG: peptide deformylase [Rhodospirillales bacterium]|jgi:peptide deformylase|nr:peptide deformylase [Rhodospirillales bacterium]MDP6774566.1 peptide deformylase [Rhodospirillales bacterium]